MDVLNSILKKFNEKNFVQLRRINCLYEQSLSSTSGKHHNYCSRVNCFGPRRAGKSKKKKNEQYRRRPGLYCRLLLFLRLNRYLPFIGSFFTNKWERSCLSLILFVFDRNKSNIKYLFSKVIYTKSPLSRTWLNTGETCGYSTRRKDVSAILMRLDRYIFEEAENIVGTYPSKSEFDRSIVCCYVDVSLGAFIIGVHVAWSSPCLKFFLSENYTVPAFVIKIEEADWLAALTPIGAVFGCIPAGIMANSQGRKTSLIAVTILQVSASVLVTFASNVMLAYIARFMSGLAFGAYCVLIPMYIPEIAEKSVRGNLGSFFELLITVGILYTYVLGLFDSYLILSHCITAAMVIYLFSLFLVPESPVYLMSKNREADAETCLRRMRGEHYDIDSEIKVIKAELEDSATRKLSFEVVVRKANLKGASYAIFLMILQQLSGIIAVIYFGETIFSNANAASPTLNTVILGSIQILGTFTSGVLVDRLGRKILLFLSAVIMSVCLATLGYYFWLKDHHTDTSSLNWMPLLCLVIYITAYGLGFGPLPWVLLGELLAPEIRKFAFAIVCVINLSLQGLMVFFFPWLMQSIGIASTFWMHSLVCALAAAFVWLLPETKNKSLREIQEKLVGKKAKVTFSKDWEYSTIIY